MQRKPLEPMRHPAYILLLRIQGIQTRLGSVELMQPKAERDRKFSLCRTKQARLSPYTLGSTYFVVDDEVEVVELSVVEFFL